MRIVFDFVGVLFDLQPHEVLRRHLPRHAGDETAARQWVQHIFQGWGGDWAEFDRGTLALPELVLRIAARTGLQAAEVRAVVEAVPHAMQPKPGTVALLRRLHDAGRDLHFLSNMPLPYAEHLEREHDFLRCFESGVISARVQQIKPEREIFDIAVRRFGADPAQLVFIDDVAGNVRAARQAGWQGVHFVDAADCEAQLRAGGWV